MAQRMRAHQLSEGDTVRYLQRTFTVERVAVQGFTVHTKRGDEEVRNSIVVLKFEESDLVLILPATHLFNLS